jgi:hypothetical protein
MATACQSGSRSQVKGGFCHWAAPSVAPGNTSRFEWNDTNNNHQSYERFCIDKASNHEIVQCGWGNVVATNGKALNWGF